jgi:hypothetical protein
MKNKLSGTLPPYDAPRGVRNLIEPYLFLDSFERSVA